MSGEEGGSGKAVAGKRLSAEELAVQAQRIKRVKDFIATVKEFKKYGEELASELMGSVKEKLLGDSSFTDRLALAVAEKLAKSGEAVDALAKNPAFVEALSKNDAIVAAVSAKIAVDPKLSGKICTELAEDPPFRGKMVSKLSHNEEFVAAVTKSLNSSPVFTDKLRANVDASVDAKEAKAKEAQSQVAQVQAAPQAVLGERDRKAIDMLAEYSDEIEAVAQNVRSNKYLAMVLSDDPKAALLEELGDREEMVLYHLKALSSMGRERLSAALSESARKIPAVSSALSSGSMSESAFGQFIADKVELAQELYYQGVHSAVVRSLEGSETEKSMEGLTKDHAEAVLYSLNMLSSMLATIPQDAALKAKSQPYLAKAMEGGFKAALVGPQMEADIEALSASSPHFTARRLLECIKDQAKMEATVGSSLASHRGYMDEVQRIYKNVLFRLVEDVAKCDDPKKGWNALKADGHDPLGMLVEITNYPVSSCGAMVENAKEVLRIEMASSFYQEGSSRTPAAVDYLLEKDRRLARLLMRDLNSMDDSIFAETIMYSMIPGASPIDPDQVRKARDLLNSEYFNSLTLVLYHSLLGSDLVSIKNTYSALVAEHGTSAMMCMRNLRRSAVALESCDPASKPVNGTAKELMRKAASVMYMKGSIARVADIVALDEAHSNLDPWEELEIIFDSDPQKTVLHLKSLQDPVTLKRELLDVTGASNVSEEYINQRSAAVQEFYGTFLVSLAIRHLAAPDHQMRMSSLPAQHPEGWQEALDIVIQHKDNRDGEVSKILKANSDPSPLDVASVVVLQRAKDYRYGIESVTRVAAALICDESDLEHVFREAPGPALLGLRALSSDSTLVANEVEAITGQKPDQDAVDSLVQSAAGNYGGMLASYMVRSLASPDRVSSMKRIAEDHPDSWREALTAVAENSDNIAQYEIEQMYPATEVEEATRVITGSARRILETNQMMGAILTASVQDKSRIMLVKQCSGDLYLAAEVLKDLTAMAPEELEAALSRAAGSPGEKISPTIFSRRKTELADAYSMVVKLIVVDSMLDLDPSGPVSRFRALSADHGALANEAVLHLSQSKTIVSENLELLSSLRGRPYDRSGLKDQTRKVCDSLKKIPVSGGASK